MGLRGQGSQGNERGYAMAALLVSLAVMSVLMSVAMPVWRHEARREKEAELAFRGEQYARAIALYRTKNGNNLPPSVDVLVQGKYLRKKYKDPVSKDGEWRLVTAGGQAGQVGTVNPTPSPNPAAAGGIIGVASKSTETSIRLYKNQTRYDMWPFSFNLVNRPGGGGPGAGAPGMPGGRGQQQPGVGGRGPGGGRGNRGTPGGGTRPGGPGPGFPPSGGRAGAPSSVRPPGG